ncbi:MAG TPA: folylpolyglutamate synthase/dihydrofolate synthase family protein [Gemmatimonadaceae bacterium]|nr:folylpolyglutamate synthase/dihydrofolate synthase family protein [Gemmatimonadaceae bacterium]
MGVALNDQRSKYRAALDYLFDRTTGKSKLGLERTAALLRELGNPHERLRSLHVAGTNGKGSACATIDTVLRAKGLRVGKYTSPHLVDFRERFLINGKRVDEEYVVEFIERWTPTVERIGATFFEATTAMAFDLFAREGVDAAVIETGLGGRLDSTNVVLPLAAGVTSIGIDHVEYLGETREEIAGEKAGIFKPGVAAVIGERDDAIRELLAKLAAERGAEPVLDVMRDASPDGVAVTAEGTSFAVTIGGERGSVRTGLAGAHQASNTALALLMLNAAGGSFSTTLEEARTALPHVRLPGRFHRVDPFIFDVAHNPDGAAVFAATVAAVRPPSPTAVVLCVLADKDWRGVMTALSPVVDTFVLTDAPTAPTSRAWVREEAVAFAGSNGWDAISEVDFDRAIARATSIAKTVLVTGSFHTVGDAMARLNVDPVDG